MLLNFARSFALALVVVASTVCNAQVEVDIKDSVTNIHLWHHGPVDSESFGLFSPDSNSPNEVRYYIGFTPQTDGVLKSIGFPVIFDNNMLPVNSPSENPFRLSVNLFENLGQLFSAKLDLDAVLDSPENDWQDAFIINVDLFDSFYQSWDLSGLEYSVNAGQTYYLAIMAVEPDVTLGERPRLLFVTQNFPFVGSQPDFYYREGEFVDPRPVSTDYESSQAAVRLTFVTSVLQGDINNDGAVDLLDVGPFVTLISTGQYAAAGDFNGDGEVTLLDVGPFVDAIIGG